MSKRIPRYFINELLERTDIVEIIRTRLTLQKRGPNYLVCCPFHQEKTPSFTVSSIKQIYHCFGCGVSGNSIGFIMAFEQVNFVEAIAIIAEQLGLTVPYEEDAKASTQEPKHENLYQILERVKNYYHQQLFNSHHTSALLYLQNRGLTTEIIKKFSLGFAPIGWNNLHNKVKNNPLLEQQLLESGMLIKNENAKIYDRFRNRIIFPIFDFRGRVIGFGGRTLTEENPKYLNSPETSLFHKGHELYGFYQARKIVAQLNSIIVVEGYMDVLALAQAGFMQSVATLGTAITHEHLIRLLRYSTHLIFCFDGDEAGKKAAWRALENILPLLQDGIEAQFIFLPEGEDPDTIIKKEGPLAFEERIKEATSLSDFFFEALGRLADLKNFEGRAKLKERAVPLLNKIPESMLSHLMQERLAAVLRIPLTELKNFLKSKPSKSASLSPKKVDKRTINSPLRLAIMLLIQYPYLGKEIANKQIFSELDLKGTPLLLEIFSFIEEEPSANTATLIEYFKGGPFEKIVLKLAVYEHCIPNEGLLKEFMGIIERLKELLWEQKVEDLLSKANQKGLTDEERQALQNLLVENRQKARVC